LSNSYCLFALNLQDTIIIPQVTITEKKHENFQIDLKLVDSVFISNNLNSSLSEILLKSTSLYSRTYGPGLIASYGIRGSNSAETLVRWNGFTVNNIMLASSDISLFSLSSNSKINIDKNSFLPGGIGGSISIEDDLSNDKNKISSSISYSSLNNLNFNNSFDFLLGNLKNSVSVILENNQNEFYFNRGESKIKITNSKGTKLIFKHNALYHKNNSTFKIFTLLNKINRQIPPSRYESSSDASQLDEGLKSGIHYSLIRNNLVLKLKAGYFIDRLKYQYPLKNIYSDSYIYTFQSGINFYWNIFGKWLLKFDFNNENSRVNTDIYGKKQENRIYFSGLVSSTITDKLLIKSGVRSVYYNSEFIPLSPYLQLNYKLNTGFKIGLNAGKNFRLPGLNDKYWPDLGVSDLKYESSSFIDINSGVNIRDRLRLSTSVYYKKTKDMIIWIPNQGIWRPENIDKVFSRGIDLDLSYNFKYNKLNSEFIFSYSYNKNTRGKQSNLNIIYSPNNIFVSNQRFMYNSWYLSLTQRYTDKVFVTYDNSESILPYFIMDVRLSRDIKIKKNKFNYIIEIYNVFNKDYETIKNYPMPGRYFSTGLKYIVNY